MGIKMQLLNYKKYMKKNEAITPYFEDGKFAGVRVIIRNEDFVIAPNNYTNGKKMTLQNAKDAIKTENLDTWNYRQVCLTMAYREEIDKVLKDNGGDKLNRLYWVNDMYGSLTYCYDGELGILDYMSYDDTYYIRPIKNLKAK